MFQLEKSLIKFTGLNLYLHYNKLRFDSKKEYIVKVFSQRNNYEPEQILQVESLEYSTRNLIWNEFYNLREHNIHKFNDLLKYTKTLIQDMKKHGCPYGIH